MCIGVPMQIERTELLAALCRGRGEARRVSLALLGELPVGSWVLVHNDLAVRELEPEEAARIADALEAAAAAEAGLPFEHLLRDLIEREPELPPHLREAKP